MRFSWDERKRRLNLKEHGLDFVDAPSVLGGIAVSIVHTETSSQIRVISFRKATRNEETILFKNLQD